METLGNQKVAISCNKYNCNICDYNTDRKSSYNKHILSRKHKLHTYMETFGNQKVAISCEQNICDDNIITNKNYDIYNLSGKQSLDTPVNILQQKVANIHKCEICNKYYKNRSGLWKHKKQCVINNINIIENNNSNEHNLTPLVLELVKQNTDFKDLIIEQNKQLIELSKERIINNNTSNSNNITYSNNNNNNNNNFNLQLFLNETCKNAMSITEFVKQIPVKLSDLEDTARLGYAEGISRIFIRGLKELEVSQRPIHCSDAKRETLYIKEGDTWEKDDTNKTKLTTAIKKVAHKNICMIPQWKKEHPYCEQYDSNKNDLYLNIVNNSMCGGSDEEIENNYNKIKKNIIKQVVIDKVSI
jgi:hypothetical protein